MTSISLEMPITTLGRTNLKVSRLALGGLFVSAMGGEFEQSKGAVKRALECGVNYIDTAPGYLNSEEVLGKILQDNTQPLILSTKLGGRPDPFQPKNKDHLRQSLEESLRLLNRDSIDILMIHEPDRKGQYDWFDDFDAATGPVMEFLDEMKQKGLIKYTGLGGTTVYEMLRLVKTGKFDVLLTAFNYSLLWREAAQDLIPEAARHKMGIVIGSPLQQGALAKRYDDQILQGAPWLSRPRREQFKALYAYLDEINLSVAEAGIRFSISNPDVSCVLMGARSSEEVDKNVEAVSKGALPNPVLKRLAEIAAMVPYRPYEEPFSLPFTRPSGGPGNAWNW